jgi:hypothetical protein
MPARGAHPLVAAGVCQLLWLKTSSRLYDVALVSGATTFPATEVLRHWRVGDQTPLNRLLPLVDVTHSHCLWRASSPQET